MPKRQKVTRREFLETSGLAASAVAALPTLRPALAADATLATKLPHRTLGRTGRSVSILAFGCGSRFLMYPEEQASAVLTRRSTRASTTSTPPSTTATARASGASGG